MALHFRPAFLLDEALRAQAAAFLAQYHPSGSIPVPIEQIVEFDLSMDVIPMEGLQQQIHVDAFLTNDLEWIYVDAQVLKFSPQRYRFSLAHEVGHYWLHDALYRQCSITSVAEWEAVQSALGPEAYRRLEWQANTFAGLVLVPPDQLRAAFVELKNSLVERGIKERDIECHPVRPRVIEQLAKQFAVSSQTMDIRLEREGLLAKLPT